MIKRTRIRSNGITFLYEQDQSADSVTAALFFKAGVLCERPREFGITQFVARLLLREITAGAPKELAFSLRCGRDHAAFLCTAPNDRAGEAVATLTRLFDAPPFDDAAIEQVRRKTLEELAAYTPTRADEEERLYFARDQYAVPLCGTERSAAALTAERLARWRATVFTRSNACFVVTGGFSDAAAKDITAFLREQPAQKHKNLNAKPVFPPDQFFRTSASDLFLPTQSDCGRIELLFEVDLGETKPVWAAMLRRLLTEPQTGALEEALTKAALTDAVRGQLRLYQGFALLSLSCAVFHRNIPNALARIAETLGAFKNSFPEKQAEALLPYYAENRLYRHAGGAERAYELGLHNFILYSDDIVLPDRCSADSAAEQLLEAIDHILIPDNALFIIHYNTAYGADLAAIRQRVTAARIRLFI